MAIYKIFPTKDASIYTEDNQMNTGLDQILECSTYLKNGRQEISRFLIQFSTDEINNIINNTIAGNIFNTYLKINAAVVTGISTDTALNFYPVSGSWGMGTGRYPNDPSTKNGVSWLWQDYSSSTYWATSGFNTYATASYTGSGTGIGGGTWYTGSNLGLNITQSKTFSYGDPIDINVDVTNTIKTWYSNSLNSADGFPNDGFIVKQNEEDEFNISLANSHIFRFFSIDTNTIYPPQLEFRWDDYSFNTGSSTKTVLDDNESFISIYNNAGVYYSESIAKFRIAAIPKYPTRVYSTASYYTTNYYLPESSSLYAIKDTETNYFVVDFDSTYTRISADANSSYFNVYMNGLEPERNYTILIKTQLDGVTKVFDEDIRFKVANR